MSRPSDVDKIVLLLNGMGYSLSRDEEFRLRKALLLMQTRAMMLASKFMVEKIEEATPENLGVI